MISGLYALAAPFSDGDDLIYVVGCGLGIDNKTSLGDDRLKQLIKGIIARIGNPIHGMMVANLEFLKGGRPLAKMIHAIHASHPIGLRLCGLVKLPVVARN
jgi:hypothetical protein